MQTGSWSGIRRIAGMALVLMGMVGSHVGAQQQDAATSRQAFAKKMAQIQRGMSRQRVLAILGKPDRQQSYASGELNYWLYGTDGPRTLATLSQVVFDASGKVECAYGNTGKPPAADMFSEPQLRQLLRLIDRAAQCGPCGGYDPLLLIQTVNTLQPLGREKALAALGEYVRVAGGIDKNGLFLVLRALFEVPDPPGYMPRLGIGRLNPQPPKDLRRVPCYPLVLIDDIPLSMVLTSSVRGPTEPADIDLEFFTGGTMRSRPLHPIDNPLEIRTPLEASCLWIYDKTWEPVARAHFLGQVLSLVRSVYIPDQAKFEKLTVEEQWELARRELAERHIHWDAEKNDYVASIQN